MHFCVKMPFCLLSFSKMCSSCCSRTGTVGLLHQVWCVGVRSCCLSPVCGSRDTALLYDEHHCRCGSHSHTCAQCVTRIRWTPPPTGHSTSAARHFTANSRRCHSWVWVCGQGRGGGSDRLGIVINLCLEWNKEISSHTNRRRLFGDILRKTAGTDVCGWLIGIFPLKKR